MGELNRGKVEVLIDVPKRLLVYVDSIHLHILVLLCFMKSSLVLLRHPTNL